MANVDKAALLELAGGEEEARDLMRIFFQSARDLLAQARDSVARRNRAETGEAIHQMAGAAGSCGLSGLERQSREMEAGLTSMTWSEITTRLDKAAESLSATETEFNALFPES